MNIDWKLNNYGKITSPNSTYKGRIVRREYYNGEGYIDILMDDGWQRLIGRKGKEEAETMNKLNLEINSLLEEES